MPTNKTYFQLLIALLFLIVTDTIAQDSKPKLVVGVVVDQMRYEYLHRFAEHYGDNGFKRLISEGFSLKTGITIISPLRQLVVIPRYTQGLLLLFTGS